MKPLAFSAAGRHRGFTLVEMVVVVALVGILASAAQPILTLAKRRSDELTLRQSLRLLRGAIDAYRQAVLEKRIEAAADASGYPPELAVLVEGAPDARAPKARRIYFLRRMPRDPFADPALAAEATWVTRSYDSSPEAFRAGRNVFDVRSQSTGRGLDGTPYREW